MGMDGHYKYELFVLKKYHVELKSRAHHICMAIDDHSKCDFLVLKTVLSCT